MVDIKKTLNGLLPGKKNVADGTDGPAPKRGMSLLSKLLLMLLAATMTAVVTIAFLGYRHGEQQIIETAFQQLRSLRVSKSQQVEWYFQNLRNVVRILGQTPTVAKSMQLFSTSFGSLDNKPGGVDVLNDEQKEKLTDYYNKEYFPKLDQLKGGKSNVEIFWPRSRAGRRAQSLYIAENPNESGKKDEFYSSSAVTSYDMVHRKFHEFYRSALKAQNFYDIFLIDGDSGDIVYSVSKETDFGTNLLRGPYAHSSLGRLYRKIRSNHSPGFVYLEDFKQYPPSYNAPASFIGTPIYTDGGLFIGVLAAQLSIEDLNGFMTNNNQWKESGLGTSGEMYLIGDDKLMRSNSRFLTEDKENYLKVLAATHTPKAIINQVQKLGTSVLFQRVNTEGVRAAFNGKTDTKVIEDYRGVRVLSSYAPLDIPDLHWVMLAEIDEAEARAPQNQFAKNVLLTSGLLLLGLTLASLFVASNFLKPISVLIDGVGRIRDGEKNVEIKRLANDEFGELSDTFNILTKEIGDRDTLIEKQSSSYNDLLNRIYPGNIVERLKKGDDKIVDSIHQASVVYVIIHGFSKQTEAMDSIDALELLTELVDNLDTTCQSMGIEKVKTIGEHYLAVCGLSVPLLDHARRALDFSHAASRELAIFNARYDLKLALRIGIHSGPLHAGIVGSYNFDFDVWGNSLNIARRIVFEAGLNKMRLTIPTYHMLNTTDDFGPEMIVDTKAVGQVATYELDLDTTLDRNRMDRRREQRKRKSDPVKLGKKKSATDGAKTTAVAADNQTASSQIVVDQSIADEDGGQQST